MGGRPDGTRCTKLCSPVLPNNNELGRRMPAASLGLGELHCRRRHAAFPVLRRQKLSVLLSPICPTPLGTIRFLTSAIQHCLFLTAHARPGARCSCASSHRQSERCEPSYPQHPSDARLLCLSPQQCLIPHWSVSCPVQRCVLPPTNRLPMSRKIHCRGLRSRLCPIHGQGPNRQ